jgi:hypothetical protein
METAIRNRWSHCNGVSLHFSERRFSNDPPEHNSNTKQRCGPSVEYASKRQIDSCDTWQSNSISAKQPHARNKEPVRNQENSSITLSFATRTCRELPVVPLRGLFLQLFHSDEQTIKMAGEDLAAGATADEAQLTETVRSFLDLLAGQLAHGTFCTRLPLAHALLLGGYVDWRTCKQQRAISGESHEQLSLELSPVTPSYSASACNSGSVAAATCTPSLAFCRACGGLVNCVELVRPLVVVQMPVPWFELPVSTNSAPLPPSAPPP